MSIQIEDHATDVLRKAMLGKGISSEMLAEKSGLPLAHIRHLRRRRADAETCSRLAPLLDLCPKKLKSLDEKFDACASGRFSENVKFPENCFRKIMFCGNKVLPEMTSNAYALVNNDCGKALLFDCGMNAEKLVGFLNGNAINDIAVCITHRHFDHAGGVNELCDAFPSARIFDFNTFFFGNAKTVCGFEFAGFSVDAISVAGHTKDSVVYVWRNPPEGPSMAFTGDTLFLGSVGGCLPGDLDESLTNIQTRLLEKLPTQTLVAPGHGPATTLEQEILENPFF